MIGTIVRPCSLSNSAEHLKILGANGPCLHEKNDVPAWVEMFHALFKNIRKGHEIAIR